MVSSSRYGKNYCVYVHKRASSGLIYYVGISGNRLRPYDLEARSELHKRINRKHGTIIEIVAEGLTLKEAATIETQMIMTIGRICDKSGPLANFKISHFEEYKKVKSVVRTEKRKRMRRKKKPAVEMLRNKLRKR